MNKTAASEHLPAEKPDYDAIQSQLWPHGGDRDAWMIVDPARNRRIYFDFLVNSHLEYSCLYSGNLAPQLEAAAPHLVQLSFDDRCTRDLIINGWGDAWGVFLRSGTTMQKLRRHLRTFLMVNDWTGKRLLFRYYDPRVLRAYLPTCATEELTTVFGPIQKFLTEDIDGKKLLHFSLNRGRLVQSETDVTTPSGGRLQ